MMRAKYYLGIVALLASVMGIAMVGTNTVLADTPPPATAVVPAPGEQVIKVNSRKFEFIPAAITLKKGVPVVLELTSADVIMGFNVPDFKNRATIIPGVVTRIRIVPDKVGTFTFFCDVFCGDGHEEMSGLITVVA
jgi:cytochrome c oxidase subunit 2